MKPSSSSQCPPHACCLRSFIWCLHQLPAWRLKGILTFVCYDVVPQTLFSTSKCLLMQLNKQQTVKFAHFKMELLVHLYTLLNLINCPHPHSGLRRECTEGLSHFIHCPRLKVNTEKCHPWIWLCERPHWQFNYFVTTHYNAVLLFTGQNYLCTVGWQSRWLSLPQTATPFLMHQLHLEYMGVAVNVTYYKYSKLKTQLSTFEEFLRKLVLKMLAFRVRR